MADVINEWPLISTKGQANANILNLLIVILADFQTFTDIAISADIKMSEKYFPAIYIILQLQLFSFNNFNFLFQEWFYSLSYL